MRVSVSRSVGLGANASDPPAQHRRHDTSRISTPSHIGGTVVGVGCGKRWDPLGLPLMDYQGRQLPEEDER